MGRWPIWGYEACAPTRFHLQTFVLKPLARCLELGRSRVDGGQLTAVWPWGRSRARKSALSSVGEAGDYIFGKLKRAWGWCGEFRLGWCTELPWEGFCLPSLCPGVLASSLGGPGGAEDGSAWALCQPRTCPWTEVPDD